VVSTRIESIGIYDNGPGFLLAGNLAPDAQEAHPLVMAPELFGKLRAEQIAGPAVSCFSGRIVPSRPTNYSKVTQITENLSPFWGKPLTEETSI